MTMLERMARAMCRAAGYDPDRIIHSMIDVETGKEASTIPRWRAYAVVARAALAELREPTEGMIHDGALAIDHPSVHMGGPSDHKKRLAAQVWRAMLAAAEEEQ